jgi:hypothetical protein
LVDGEGATGSVRVVGVGVGDALIETEGSPGGAGDLKVEIGDYEEDVWVDEGVREAVRGWD